MGGHSNRPAAVLRRVPDVLVHEPRAVQFGDARRAAQGLEVDHLQINRPAEPVPRVVRLGALQEHGVRADLTAPQNLFHVTTGDTNGPAADVLERGHGPGVQGPRLGSSVRVLDRGEPPAELVRAPDPRVARRGRGRRTRRARAVRGLVAFGLAVAASMVAGMCRVQQEQQSPPHHRYDAATRGAALYLELGRSSASRGRHRGSLMTARRVRRISSDCHRGITHSDAPTADFIIINCFC